MIRTGSVLKRLDILKEATARKFSGGLNVADSELNLSSEWARELNNMVVGIDGSLQVRQGSRLIVDIDSLTDGTILDHRFFADHLIVVDTIGQLFAVDSQSIAERIWDAEIADHQRDGLTIWTEFEHVHFAEFNGELVVANGVDKPLAVRMDLHVDYLADPATGSNINVPVSSVFAKHDRHLVWAVDRHNIVVSERDAHGVYPGDPGAIYTGIFDLSSYVSSGNDEIVGMISFKGFLLVMFEECIVPVQFTEITDPAPALQIAVSPDSVMDAFGTISDRTLQDIGEQSLGLDIVGVASTSLAKLTKILSPDRPSRLVDPLIQKIVGRLKRETAHHDSFAVYDRRQSTYMLFVPNDNSVSHIHGFAFRYIKSMDIEAWSVYRGWRWQCGSRSLNGRMYFTPRDSTKIYVLGDQTSDPLYSDFVGDQETFTDETCWDDNTGFSPIVSVAESGIPIEWSWELPWSDMKKRGYTKTLRYPILDTEGDQHFTMQVFVDNRDKVIDGGEAFTDGTVFDDNLGFERVYPIRSPALEARFIGKDAGGYGFHAYGNSPYGGGNNTASHGLTLMPTKFEIVKFRFSGDSLHPLKIVAITPLYQLGSFRRMLV